MAARARTRVETWYDGHTELEEHRLDDCRLEFEVTMRVISSCIANLKLDRVEILDIGGGPGRYAIALTKKGHAVTLNDLSEKSLEVAIRNARKEDVELKAIVHANALAIMQHASFQASHGLFDVVLCLGPLYHLLAPEERSAVISNCLSMTKPGGYVLLAYVTVYAHLRDMARRDPSRLSKEWDFYKEYLDSGKYTRNVNNESFHIHPADLEMELETVKSQVSVVRTVSCEGILGSDLARGLAAMNEEEMQHWVDIIMKSAELKETLNSADHLLVVLQKL